MVKFILYFILVALLTLLSQIGGVVLLLSTIISTIWKKKIKYKLTFIFLSLYLVFTFLIIPITAPIFGRVKLPNNDLIKPATFATILLNRNYVKPEINIILERVVSKLKGSNIKVTYLDANFPFIDGFPLLPHLSHNDGKKLDLALIYEETSGNIVDKHKSNSGYGNFEEPRADEINQIEKCKSNGYFQYDYPKYFTFGKINDEILFSKKGTKMLISTFLQNSEIEKVFIEPHLKIRMQLFENRIRYHGCRAVRHDDHIHIEIK